jgi:hypothetical membrane protein
MNHYPISTRALATSSLAGMATLPLLVVALHVIQRGHYHPLSQAVSQLALGRDGWLLAIAFCAAGTGTLCFAILLRRTVAGSVVAPALVAISALGTFVSAVFHADGEQAKTTLHGQIHQTAGIVSFVLVIAAGLVSSRRFRSDPAWQRLARPTLIWALCAVGALFLPSVLGDAYFGVAQRIFIAIWLIWPVTVAAYARQSASTVDDAALARSRASQTVHA